MARVCSKLMISAGFRIEQILRHPAIFDVVPRFYDFFVLCINDLIVPFCAHARVQDICPTRRHNRNRILREHCADVRSAADENRNIDAFSEIQHNMLIGISAYTKMAL